ncbi:c-type cytochrome domain-containing protein [Roseimaritima ulvae]|uniref:Chromosome partition protein Smc n=1 Tax=Roseimaritima ulvae TaxID=980254 RepID=A0A5B9QKU5_9BACT|nr:c-type cytochrome domain-containing protein [Roseimaritima ulvae]QEG38609.1 Chromosome partition protein Smc [Roseimaritima ulvae]
MLRYPFSRLLAGVLVCSSVVVYSALVAPSVSADDAAAKEGEVKKITYEDHIKPIFREKCLTCHNQGEAKGGLALDTYGSTMTGGGSGEIVYDGDAESSRLWQLVAHEDTPVMPPEQEKIPEAQINLIKDWINGGLLENSGSKAKKKKANPLAFAGATSGKPEGGGAMPEAVIQQPVVISERAGAATSIAASPWAPLVAIGGQRQIVLYNTDTAELVGILPFPEGLIQSLRFSRNGAFLIAGGGADASRGMVTVYDVKTGDRLSVVGDELDTVLGADVNDRMTRIALGGPQKMLRIYDLADGELLFDIKKHTDWIYDVAYSPDGVLLASCDRAAGLLVWEAETGRNYLNLTDHKDAINALSWRDDSNVLATASDDGTVKLFEMNEGKVIKSINAHGGGVLDVAFDHKGQLVTCGKDNRVRLWDASGNKKADFPAMPEQVLEVTISHDSKRIIAGDWTGQTLCWNAEDPKAPAQAMPANPQSLEQRIAASTADVAALSAPVTAAETAAKDLQAQIAATTDQKNTAVAAQQQKTQQAEQKKAEKTAAEQAVAALTNQRNQLRGDADQKQQALQGSLEKLKTDAAVEPQVAAQEKALADSLQKVAAKREELVGKQNAVKQLAAAEAALRAEAEKMKPAIAAADKKLAELNDKLTAAQATVTSAKTARDAAAAKLQQLQQALTQFQQRGAELAKAAEAAGDDENGQRVKDQAALFSTAYAQ